MGGRPEEREGLLLVIRGLAVVPASKAHQLAQPPGRGSAGLRPKRK